MTGHNHFAWCDCGWCTGGGGGGRRNRSVSHKRFLPPKVTVSSLLIPNASCPVCQQSVYYYQNDIGSRVFFDTLWPDWIKHPCTDNGRPVVLRSSNGPRTPTPNLEFPTTSDLSHEWIPLTFQRRDVEDGWYVLRFETTSGDLLRVLTNSDSLPRRDSPVFMQKWDVEDQTVIQFLDQDFSLQLIWGWKYSRWFLDTPAACVERREKSASNST
jgi:hypothetical protein